MGRLGQWKVDHSSAILKGTSASEGLPLALIKFPSNRQKELRTGSDLQLVIAVLVYLERNFEVQF